MIRLWLCAACLFFLLALVSFIVLDFRMMLAHPESGDAAATKGEPQIFPWKAASGRGMELARDVEAAGKAGIAFGCLAAISMGLAMTSAVLSVLGHACRLAGRLHQLVPQERSRAPEARLPEEEFLPPLPPPEEP
jgi:hypothetical protein